MNKHTRRRAGAAILGVAFLGGALTACGNVTTPAAGEEVTEKAAAEEAALPSVEEIRDAAVEHIESAPVVRLSFDYSTAEGVQHSFLNTFDSDEMLNRIHATSDDGAEFEELLTVDTMYRKANEAGWRGFYGHGATVPDINVYYRFKQDVLLDLESRNWASSKPGMREFASGDDPTFANIAEYTEMTPTQLPDGRDVLELHRPEGTRQDGDQKLYVHATVPHHVAAYTQDTESGFDGLITVEGYSHEEPLEFPSQDMIKPGL